MRPHHIPIFRRLVAELDRDIRCIRKSKTLPHVNDPATEEQLMAELSDSLVKALQYVDHGTIPPIPPVPDIGIDTFD